HTCHLSLSFSSILLLSLINAPSTTQIYTLSLHDALPISNSIITCGALRERNADGSPRHRFSMAPIWSPARFDGPRGVRFERAGRSEEHTSELQSRVDLVCRLLLEKKNDVHVLMALVII